ncbi:MAG: polysulfide reductase NrfD [Magnetococcales bacterium]|nr:polysulfide reductase NrfD [Magnetococcales bacterium]NGZ04975.1 polysulfide reductase NrfD [Magnetococcales bacterium]
MSDTRPVRSVILRFALRIWVVVLSFAVVQGGWAWHEQWRLGLVVTGMSDQLSWGLYIGQFVFLVGVAASAVVLVIPAYWLGIHACRSAVVIGEALSVTAVSMALMFVWVDLGQPLRVWHALPWLGTPNFPASIMAWDLLVLTAYLGVNVGLLIGHGRGHRKSAPLSRHRLFWFVVATLLGLSIHTVTAFLLAGLPARPMWNTGLLAPRFIASALVSGCAWLLVTGWILAKVGTWRMPEAAGRLLTGVMTGALVIYLFMGISEWFVLFYHPTAHGHGAGMLYLGWEGKSGLTLWMIGSVGVQGMAAMVLVVRPWRRRPGVVLGMAMLLFVALFVEKGVGLIVPGLQPTPLGEWVAYRPTVVELRIAAAIWAGGLLLFTGLLRLLCHPVPREPECGSASTDGRCAPPRGPE